MKYAVFAAALFGSSIAFAHGTLPEQAASAVQAAAEMLEQSQPRDVLNKLGTVTAIKSGHEAFEVEFLMTDDSKFSYACQEDESTNPLKWMCLAR